MIATPAPWQRLDAQLRPFVARRVAAHDVDDVMQEVFVRVQRGLPGLRDDERFTAWLFQIARNAVAEHHRGQARLPVPAGDAVAEADHHGGIAPTPDPDDRAEATALAGCIAFFVSTLPSPYREAVTLVELEGRTSAEAAAMVGISVSGMKSRVQRGRAQLRETIDKCCVVALDARGKPTEVVPRPQPCRSCS